MDLNKLKYSLLLFKRISVKSIEMIFRDPSRWHNSLCSLGFISSILLFSNIFLRNLWMTGPHSFNMYREDQSPFQAQCEKILLPWSIFKNWQPHWMEFIYMLSFIYSSKHLSTCMFKYEILLLLMTKSSYAQFKQ